MKYNLSEAEYEIMKFIWEQGDNISFNDIMEYTQKKGHTWKKQTVQTFLTRLIDKGVLKAEKVETSDTIHRQLQKQSIFVSGRMNF